MELPRFKPVHTFVLLLTFWSIWIYTEVGEYFDREIFANKVNSFMQKGGRNTALHGYNLCLRISRLENNHLDGTVYQKDCAHIYYPAIATEVEE